MDTDARLPDRQTRVYITVFSLFLVVCVGLLRYSTGPDYAFTLFYLGPIVLASWFAGFWGAIFIAAASAVSWLIADLFMTPVGAGVGLILFNEMLRLIVFLVIAFFVSTLRQRLDISRSDYLTGLANVRRFLEMADIEIRQSRRHARPMTVIFLDLDGFKRVNDEFGHTFGDKALCAAANCIQKGVRNIDVVARFGGDEFLVLMPETTLDEARVVVDRLHEGLLGCTAEKGWATTFSAGVATFATPPDDVRDVLRRTDELMYSAKAAGKDTVKYQEIP